MSTDGWVDMVWGDRWLPTLSSKQGQVYNVRKNKHSLEIPSASSRRSHLEVRVVVQVVSPQRVQHKTWSKDSVLGAGEKQLPLRVVFPEKQTSLVLVLALKGLECQAQEPQCLLLGSTVFRSVLLPGRTFQRRYQLQPRPCT